MQRSPITNSLQQMSPLSLVTHGNPQNQHRLMGAPPIGQLPSIVPHDIEQRMLEYIKLFQAPKDMKRELCNERIITKNGFNILSFIQVHKVPMFRVKLSTL